ncbi:hypothetical protein BH10PSE19_BH10PSE19_11760 [soil metagenome]
MIKKIALTLSLLATLSVAASVQARPVLAESSIAITTGGFYNPRLVLVDYYRHHRHHHYRRPCREKCWWSFGRRHCRTVCERNRW